MKVAHASSEAFLVKKRLVSHECTPLAFLSETVTRRGRARAVMVALVSNGAKCGRQVGTEVQRACVVFIEATREEM